MQLPSHISDIAFINGSFDHVLDTYAKWKKRVLHDGRHLVYEERDEDLMDSLNTLYPLSSLEQRKSIIIETQSDWIAIFGNGYMSSDLHGIVSYASLTMRTSGINIGFTDDSGVKNKAPFGSCQWEFIKYNGKGLIERERVISLINEGTSWKFFQRGEPFEFENQSNYQKSPKKNRFNLEMLESYLSHFDIHVFSEEFYSGRKAFCEVKGPRYPNSRDVYFDENGVPIR